MRGMHPLTRESPALASRSRLWKSVPVGVGNTRYTGLGMGQSLDEWF